MRGVITRDGDQWAWVFIIGPSRLRVILSGSQTRSPRLRSPAEAGFAEFSVMDHYFQIEQRARAEEAMLEGYTTLAYLAALTTRMRLAALESPGV